MYQMAYTVMYPLHDLLWMNQELIILIYMASYWDELNQEMITQSLSLKMIILFFTLFLFHICIFAYSLLIIMINIIFVYFH